MSAPPSPVSRGRRNWLRCGAGLIAAPAVPAAAQTTGAVVVPTTPAAPALPAVSSGPPASCTLVTADAAAPHGFVRVTARPADGPVPAPDSGLAGWAAVPADGDTGFLSADSVPAIRASGVTLVRMQAILDDYVLQDRLDDRLLRAVADTFAILRAAGVKVVLRFMYSSPRHDYKMAVDAPLPRVLAHIAQLGPVVRAARDGIAFIEAGFVGPWGEWHTSSNDLTRPWAREYIRDALLEHLAGDRWLLVRRPAFVRAWADAGRAHGLGLHNDAILTLGRSNGNTWAEPADRPFAEAFTAHAPYGGEAAGGPTYAAGADDVEREFRALHQCWINGMWSWRTIEAVLQRDGRRDAIVARIGPRIVLDALQLPARPQPGIAFAVSLSWHNDGYARVPYGRPVQLCFVPAAGGVTTGGVTPGGIATITLPGADPRALPPQTDAPSCVQAMLLATPHGAGVRLRAVRDADRADAPACILPAGRYRVGVRMPDPSPSLSADARFCLRPANADDVRGPAAPDAPGDGAGEAPGWRWLAGAGVFVSGLRLDVAADGRVAFDAGTPG